MKQQPGIGELLRRLEEMPAFLEERSRRFDGEGDDVLVPDAQLATGIRVVSDGRRLGLKTLSGS